MKTINQVITEAQNRAAANGNNPHYEIDQIVTKQLTRSDLIAIAKSEGGWRYEAPAQRLETGYHEKAEKQLSEDELQEIENNMRFGLLSLALNRR